jgi:hypothetical protein
MYDRIGAMLVPARRRTSRSARARPARRGRGP